MAACSSVASSSAQRLSRAGALIGPSIIVGVMGCWRLVSCAPTRTTATLRFPPRCSKVSQFSAAPRAGAFSGTMLPLSSFEQERRLYGAASMALPLLQCSSDLALCVVADAVPWLRRLSASFSPRHRSPSDDIMHPLHRGLAVRITADHISRDGWLGSPLSALASTAGCFELRHRTPRQRQ